MARDALTGSRIRERRTISGLKQADLARQIGISASYLNLIEHNRRRIGGKLLLDIATALKVEPAALTEGAEAALIAALREAAEKDRMPAAERDRAEEFAGRFPGWAEALASAHRRIGQLERTVETLSDRLSYDPELAASMHEVLSTAAAIRSTASILAEDTQISPEWLDRFHANIDADSRRLADSSKALVGFLDAETGEAMLSATPQEEVEAFLAAHDYDVAKLITDAKDELLDDAPQLSSVAARRVGRTVLNRIEADVATLPESRLRAAVADHGAAPVALAAACAAPLPLVMRRLALMPDLGCGLVVADRAGSLLFRKSVRGFAIPKQGAACPLWPLFQVMGQPGQALGQRVRMPGHEGAVFDCFATAETVGPVALNAPPLVEATMLIVPVPHPEDRPETKPVALGPSCRICPRRECAGRREPSILSEGF
ncbi:MAG: short-chain fatty acyl-CoA regulator family protein [Pseudomonadota bacterium]